MKVKLNAQKNIGNIALVVEGDKYEHNLLKHIFTKVLNYDLIEKRRQCDFSVIFQKKLRINSTVAVISGKTNNISCIKNGTSYVDNILQRIEFEFALEIDNIAIFYLYDRDPCNNPKECVLDCIASLKDPYDNEAGRGGLLLLSYPSIDGYLTSCFCEQSYLKYFQYGKEVKPYNSQMRYMPQKIDESAMVRAAEELLNYMKYSKLTPFGLDQFGDKNLNLFLKQEDIYGRKSGYNLLSLLSIVFLYLGILEIDE